MNKELILGTHLQLKCPKCRNIEDRYISTSSLTTEENKYITIKCPSCNRHLIHIKIDKDKIICLKN